MSITWDEMRAKVRKLPTHRDEAPVDRSIREATHSWVAYRACGCMVYCSVDYDTKSKSEMARQVKTLGELTMDGYRVERVLHEVVHQSRWSCPACKSLEVEP